VVTGVDKLQSLEVKTSPKANSGAAVPLRLGGSVMPRKPVEKIVTIVAFAILLCASLAIGVELGKFVANIWR